MILSPQNLRLRFQQMAGAQDAIFGHISAHSLATGPWIADPFISPLSFTMTPALSSKYMKVPSRRRQAFFWRMTTPFNTFFLNSGFPFLQVHRTMSPGPQFGILLSLPPIPRTAMMNRFFAPLLSAQFMSVKTPQPRDIFNFATRPAFPRFIAQYKQVKAVQPDGTQ